MTWVGTVSGRKIDFLAPDPDELVIEDIATGLAHINRFAGQTLVPYSVAQHSVYCSLYCPSHPFDALMHDFPEAYMSDVPRPLKRMLGEAWVELEHRLYEVGAAKFGMLPKIPPEVKDVDDRMLFTERRDIQPDHMPWPWKRNPYLWRIKPWGPKRAKAVFLKRFHQLSEAKQCRHSLV
jgi:hypothetical protein